MRMEKPGSSKHSDLVIVTPNELEKLYILMGSEAKDVKETILSVADEDVVTSTPVTKKRGRKRKSEQSLLQISPIKEKTVILDESRSGRKRRKVNYLELANELKDDDDGHKKICKSSVTVIDKVKRRKPSTDEKFDTLKESKSNGHNKSEIYEAEENAIVTDDATVHKNNENEKKPRKYRKTGETVTMVNSIFAAAFKNSLKSEVDGINISNEANLSSVDNHEVSTDRRRGRKKKSQELENIVIDQDNMVTCITCNKKVNNDDWSAHNKHEHNNLAWREGEQEVMLDEKVVVAKILKPIFKENKEINCKKCKSSFKKVQDFISHMEKCNGIISSNGLVTCAICKMEMEKTKWSNHKQRQHNNLAWRIGDHPLNLNDQNLVMGILTALYKAKKPLFCDKCGTSKKSVIGFLSHQSQCGESLEEVKVKCKFCERRVLPVSMSTHIKMVHETPKEKSVRKEAGFFDIDSGINLTKRKAAKSALLVISKLSNETIVQEHSEYYLGQANFSEEDFVELYLKKELANNNIIRCKFNSCLYESDSVMNVVEHMNSCTVKPEQYFTCKKCLLITITEEEMREHFKKIHDIDIVDDEYQNIDNYEDAEDDMWEQYDMEIKRRSLHERSKIEKDSSYKAKPTCLLNIYKRPNRLFSQAYNFTIKFCQQHYSKEEIFKSLYYLKSDWLLLDDKFIEEYLPRHSESCDVTRSIKDCGSDNYTFKKFKLFESECIEGSATIFCGGPVQALAWMPTPFTSSECRQVLAVAPLTDFNEKYLVTQHYNEPSLIQFWDFGILKNKHPLNEPKLMFCLSFEYGPVWHMEWCPSGCFDLMPEEDSAEIPRMGLLAVAGSDSRVYIFSIPHLKDEQMGLIYKVKPLLKLYFAFDEKSYSNKQKFFATKISWSKASGHRYLAVGYTDGMVGLFDLESSSLLRNNDTHDCKAVLPFKSFRAHQHIITAIDLIHLADGKRWLLTGSFDRYVTIWDINNNLKITSKRSIISDGVWLTHWLSFLTTADESSTSNNAVSTNMSPYRDYLYERINMLTSKSSVKSVSSSSWLNGIMFGTSMGEVIALFPQQLLYGLDNDRKMKNYRYLFGSTKLINKSLTSNEICDEKETLKFDVSETNEDNTQSKAKPAVEIENIDCDIKELFAYQKVVEKYGLLFSDSKMDSYKNFINKNIYKDENEFSKANLYPLQAINKVAFNPNLQASLYYAAGYQAGFVRVSYMKFLENDLQIK